MRILFLCQHYWPEEQNYFVHELALNLAKRGHEISVLTSFPHYGADKVYPAYQGKFIQSEVQDGVKIFRSYVYVAASKKIVPRLINFGSFCCSSLPYGFYLPNYDVVYTWLPPLPLGLTGLMLSKMKKSKFVLHIQDLYPRAAVEHGVIHNKQIIRLFENMEKYIYHKADFSIVISDGFKDHLMSKGVSSSKIGVVANWADPNFFQIGSKENAFRNKLNPKDNFVVIYSGGINNNANLEPLIHAADLLRDEPFLFVIIGDGQHKPRLEQLLLMKSLRNVQFFPFQPMSHYPEVLRAADINVVSLNRRSTFTSVPSKVYKLLAAGRPILAITQEENELFRLVKAAKCGLCVPPDEPNEIAGVLRWYHSHPNDLDGMGMNGRTYLEENNSLQISVDKIEHILNEIINL